MSYFGAMHRKLELGKKKGCIELFKYIVWNKYITFAVDKIIIGNEGKYDLLWHARVPSREPLKMCLDVDQYTVLKIYSIENYYFPYK